MTLLNGRCVVSARESSFSARFDPGNGLEANWTADCDVVESVIQHKLVKDIWHLPVLVQSTLVDKRRDVLVLLQRHYFWI